MPRSDDETGGGGIQLALSAMAETCNFLSLLVTTLAVVDNFEVTNKGGLFM